MTNEFLFEIVSNQNNHPYKRSYRWLFWCSPPIQSHCMGQYVLIITIDTWMYWDIYMCWHSLIIITLVTIDIVIHHIISCHIQFTFLTPPLRLWWVRWLSARRWFIRAASCRLLTGWAGRTNLILLLDITQVIATRAHHFTLWLSNIYTYSATRHNIEYQINVTNQNSIRYI